ncbi:hypothetical protein A2334_03860 [Candidatus Roizmanbacteria bacterium RIFOXYB2_FULL_38_10]|uniref:HTH cro/C1-type domain-containing protein n=1 Tax=Candidatus Roizmanbacteria bacterium RIFOXYD1_FULL_38_12 TaxID=1802093 RepID=A0A1F7L1J1_9BACT|nr:MAG: hypothetical protein A3K47_04005 [Candidatus Roizmanbacteria bacterium RIFOXYA2_FULL_38_14]OGK63921.1 MAG: hypothetical protein A3K27_04005 [Candidatus Roizmanbacteria bacterium RIFOXYA1_FULL_37_12]OGK65767.1 MAG: hypothetical protein A3K38_04005 [Candidatus Roizmanbacteria bacterium RIFOXYB1_FULL_40_23]OGK68461.1 MAG: hypothetical protein A2334_03860 [Candidatus Roizmanbacteria bacterium RIFOXYB2_FULL_38_10]OGK70172.1 MAG: hypothetical protein A3K21_04010 [Candidatus Roizmanbacteria ba
MKGNFVYKRLGQRIYDERKRRGLSQEDLAGITTLHRTHIARIEKGYINPSFMTLYLLARKFRMNVSRLLKGV